jgi:hypothetical protein
MSDSDTDLDQRVRTFVLISGLPTAASDDALFANDVHLRQTLRAQTVGMMRVLVDRQGHPGHALALYESRQAAIAAAEPGKVLLAHGPESDLKETVLVLRPILNEAAGAPERVFSETISVQGETVLKSDLAPTMGLDAALKTFVNAGEQQKPKGAAAPAAAGGGKGGGAAGKRRGPDGVPRWCHATQRGEDCPHGTNCWYIHRKSCQVTVVPARFRARPASDDSGPAGPGAAAAAAGSSSSSSGCRCRC